MRSIKLLPVLCLGLLTSTLLPSASQAQASAPSSATMPATGPVAPIAALYEALGQIEKSPGSFAQRSQILAPSIDRSFDLQTVLQNSLGLRYRTVPEAQKVALLDQFRQFTIARYVSNFGAGGTDTFKVDPTPTPSPIAGDEVVHTKIVSGGATTEVNYVMRQSDGTWRAVDVLLNGNISQVAVQRADFGSGLTSGDATPLIDSLKKKTQAFSTS
jgi:phospholipid transport system substrate-binding protein